MKMQNGVKIALLLVVLAASNSPAMCGNGGWIEMATEDLNSSGWRSRSPTSYVSATADVNADGIADKASLVVSSDGERSGVRVCLGGDARAKRLCKVIGESENIAKVMGLQRIPAGCYDYIEDDQGIPSTGRKVCSKGDAISYFRFGSSSSFFLYDVEKSAFARYWDSD